MKTAKHSRRSTVSNLRFLHRFLSSLTATTLLALAATPMKTLAQTVNNGPNLSIDVTTNRHSISPSIYGMNQYGLDKTLAQELKIPVVRWGGDNATRYNWLADASNPGGDWYFAGYGYTHPAQPSGQTDALVNLARSWGGQAMITIPIIQYVQKDANLHCGFSVKKYGKQQSIDPWARDCGNGKRPNGAKMTGNNPLDTSMANSPSLMQGWINHFQATFGNAANGGVQLYQMDNEPGGWANTHRDIHPNRPTYDEIVNRTFSYAAMVKATEPNAQVLGPSDFGWYIYIGANADIQKHGGLWNAPWYLQRMHDYETAHHVRILDYFDEHYYPSGPGDDQWRLRSTRSLWDPTYKDESGINQPVMLIPRMKQWISQYYPNTKTAITEYNWGALNRLNGALAEADVLGIFGREGLDLATIWGPPKSTDPGAYAFRMYLNYDGQGNKFGDTAVSSTSDDQSQLTIYGAQRSSDQALTLMIINKTSNDLTTNLSLNGFTPTTNASVYTYSAANLSAIVPSTLVVTASGFSTTFPANSITLVVMQPQLQS